MKRYSKLQTCPLVILYSISANSPSKQQGGRHIVIGAMGGVDRVITLGGGGGGGRKPETGIIYKPHIVGIYGLQSPRIPREHQLNTMGTRTLRVHPSLSLEKSFGVLQVVETKVSDPGNQLQQNNSNHGNLSHPPQSLHPRK